MLRTSVPFLFQFSLSLEPIFQVASLDLAFADINLIGAGGDFLPGGFGRSRSAAIFAITWFHKFCIRACRRAEIKMMQEPARLEMGYRPTPLDCGFLISDCGFEKRKVGVMEKWRIMAGNQLYKLPVLV